MIRCSMLTRDDAGEELLEYALAAAIIGLAGYLTLSSVAPAMVAAHNERNKSVQALWEPPAPGQ